MIRPALKGAMSNTMAEGLPCREIHRYSIQKPAFAEIAAYSTRYPGHAVNHR